MFGLLYFSMTSCNSTMVFGPGPGLTPLTAAKITSSSVMSGVLALS